MELNINITETVDGNLTVTELAYEEGQYAESIEQQFENNSVLFNESASITVLKQHTSKSEVIIKAFIHNHESLTVSNTFDITDDGWYEIFHLIIPDTVWLEQAIEKNYLNNFETIYITDKERLYIYKDDILTEVDIEDVINNTTTTNIWTVDKNTFILFNLWQCYLNICKNMLENNCDAGGLSSNCSDCEDEQTKNGYLVRIFMNAIQYLVSFGEMSKAQELLETISTCNSFCSNEPFSKNYNCGCSS